MQLMSDRSLSAASVFLREADGDVRLVQRAIALATQQNGGNPPPRGSVERIIREQRDTRGQSAAATG